MKRNEENLLAFLAENRSKVLNSYDAQRFETVLETIGKILSSLNLPLPYGPYDANRFRRIEEKLFEILPPEKVDSKPNKFQSVHWFLLLTAIWVQDIGMCPNLFGDMDKVLEIEKKDQWTKEVRELHPKRSAEFVKKYAVHLGSLTETEKNDLIKMCELHRRKDYLKLYSIESKSDDDKTNLPLLIAYLRLADSLHVPDRVNDDSFKIHQLIGVDDTIRFHWFKSRYVNDVIIDPDNHTIEIEIKKPKDIEVDPFMAIVQQELQDELESIRGILYEGDLTFYLKVNCKTKDSPMRKIDLRQLDELLANIQLFDSTLTPSASLVIDIVIKQIKIMMDKNDPQRSIINLLDYSSSVLIDIIKERPCYVMLTKILTMLYMILHQQKDDSQKLEEINTAIARLLESRKEALEKIQRNSFEVILRGQSVLVYGFSSTVVRCLEYCLSKIGRRITVFVCEARPKTKYRFNNRLIYSDCIKYIEELEKAQIRIVSSLPNKSNLSYNFDIVKVPDSGAANLLSYGKVDLVLLGANGICLTGDVAHTLGHLSIADMACIYGVPVYVLANSIKIGNFRKNPTSTRGNEWLTTDLFYAPKIKKHGDYNPREDIVPASRIEAIITEKGISKPSKIKTQEDKEWPKNLLD